MRILKLLPLVIGLLSYGAFPAIAQNLALVISNGHYEHGPDEADISRRHQQLVSAFSAQGYEVVAGRDMNRLEIRQLLNEFTNKLEGADIAVISLQGNVANFDGRTWFLPVDLDADTVTTLEFRAISMDYFGRLLGRKAGKSVLFVGGTGRITGVIPMVSAGVGLVDLPRGVMMVSGDYGPVERIIKSGFLRRNTRVSDVLRGNLGNLLIEGDIPGSLRLANRRHVDTPEETEQKLGLTRNTRRQIQQDLTDLGYDPRGVDGVFGSGTRAAIAEWQRRERLFVSGFITRPQITQLHQEADSEREVIHANDRSFWARTGADGSEVGLRRYLQRYPNGLFANRARAELARINAGTDEQAWARAVQLDTPAGYQEYLRDYPNGIYKNIARQRISTPPTVVENDAQLAENALRLTPLTRLLIEQRVAELGYATGPRDGNFDLLTRRGFRQFQQDRNMPVTGYVSADMIRRLLLNQ